MLPSVSLRFFTHQTMKPDPHLKSTFICEYASQSKTPCAIAACFHSYTIPWWQHFTLLSSTRIPLCFSSCHYYSPAETDATVWPIDLIHPSSLRSMGGLPIGLNCSLAVCFFYSVVVIYDVAKCMPGGFFKVKAAHLFLCKEDMDTMYEPSD